MEQYCAVFALLPLGLFSLLSRGRSSDAGFGWFAALAPVVPSALGVARAAEVRVLAADGAPVADATVLCWTGAKFADLTGPDRLVEVPWLRGVWGLGGLTDGWFNLLPLLMNVVVAFRILPTATAACRG